MEFYHAKYPVVRLLWFYVVEEMVTSKNERAGIHPQEVFASQCDDEVGNNFNIDTVVKILIVVPCLKFFTWDGYYNL